MFIYKKLPTSKEEELLLLG